LFTGLPGRTATIIGFSVKAPRSIETLASSKNIPLYTESVIYRLIELVRTKVAGLLPPIIETRVNGEATVLQVFTIAVKGQKEGQVVAGCRVGNGVVGKGDVVRVLRGEGREVVFEGQSPSLLSRGRWGVFYRVSGSNEDRSKRSMSIHSSIY
jgi:translation initiation factor IF-2